MYCADCPAASRTYTGTSSETPSLTCPELAPPGMQMTTTFSVCDSSTPPLKIKDAVATAKRELQENFPECRDAEILLAACHQGEWPRRNYVFLHSNPPRSLQGSAAAAGTPGQRVEAGMERPDDGRSAGNRACRFSSLASPKGSRGKSPGHVWEAGGDERGGERKDSLPSPGAHSRWGGLHGHAIATPAILSPSRSRFSPAIRDRGAGDRECVSGSVVLPSRRT